MKLLRSKNGFSLAEVICVMAVIACLAAISVPVYTGWIDRAKDARLEMEAQSLKTSIQMYVLYSCTQNDWDGIQLLEAISNTPVTSEKNPVNEYLTVVPTENWWIETVTLNQYEVEELVMVSKHYKVVLTPEEVRIEHKD